MIIQPSTLACGLVYGGHYILINGVVTIILAWLVAFKQYAPVAGKALAVSCFFNLLLLFYNLPNIDGLGERAFPSIFSLAVPLLGAQIEWWGPLTMILGLGLMFWSAAQAQIAPQSNRDEFHLDDLA